MTKQEQIEEMISAMTASNNPFVDVPIDIMPKVAEALYNAGYRKLPKDSVVLSREEYERLKRVENEKDRLYEIKLDLENQLIEKGWTDYEGADEIEKRVSKETAEKILDLLVPDCKACDENWHSGCLCLRATLAEKIAKQFGLEIKE